VWSELYTRSPDNPRAKFSGNPGAVIRNEKKSPPAIDVMRIHPSLDIINYESGLFSISWAKHVSPVTYFFRLYDAGTNSLVFIDSTTGNTISVKRFIKFIKRGAGYTWTVDSRDAVSDQSREFNYHTAGTTNKMISEFTDSNDLAEDEGSRYFRFAFMMEQRHFMADAYLYYKKAVQASPGMKWYQEKLNEFESDLLLGKYSK
jgi:hypothetical protein